MNIHVPSVRATHIFCSLGYMAQYNRWIKWYLPSRFQQQLYHLPSHQQYFCTSYQHVISHLFDSSHPSGYKVVSHCGFDFHFPTDIEHLFSAYWPFVCLLWRKVYSNLLPFFNWVVLVLNCKIKEENIHQILK